MRRARLSIAAALAASLVLAGCGGGDDGSDAEGDEGAHGSKGTGEQAVLAGTWPLTGLEVSGSQSAEKKHPVYVVKIDNTSSSAPQIGLGKADLVVEELVEGGSTRLATFFYSQIPSNVGPVRSMRASDIGIVKPSGGEVVTSGAAGVTIQRINGAGIKFYGEGAAGMYRDSGRSAPYNLFVDLGKLAKANAKSDAARPADYLPWGEASDLPKGQKATTIAASFGQHTTNWKFSGGKYDNLNTHAASGDQFRADTVLVLRVQVGDAGYKDPAGNFVPETKFHGQGEAMLFHDGRVVRGSWSKKDAGSVVSLKTKAGELEVPAGKVWIELVPADSGNVTFQK